jgi:hypothetical protein
MIASASLVSNSETTAYSARADAFSARTRFENVIEQTRTDSDSRYVRLMIDGVAYEGTMHVSAR